VIESPYRSLRFLANYVHPRQLPWKLEITYSCFIRKFPRHDTSRGLSIWNVEPRDVWDPEQRIISISDSDKRHIVLRLWRKYGEGYAVILEDASIGYWRWHWRYCVFKESCDQPRSYDFHSASERNNPQRAPLYESIWSSDLKIKQGEISTLARSNVFLQIIDIETAENAIDPVSEREHYRLREKFSPRPIEEMRRWTPTTIR
jgi:hypothetical protein